MSQINKANVQLVVDALRSGEFRQGKRSLAQRIVRPGGLPSPGGEVEYRFCCLGVACEVAMANGVQLVRDHDGNRCLYMAAENVRDAETTVLPKIVQQWLGVSEHNPLMQLSRPVPSRYGNDEQSVSLAQLNDEYGWNFEQIAEAMEYQWLRPAEEAADV